jgi:hypothetical protein
MLAVSALPRLACVGGGMAETFQFKAIYSVSNTTVSK